jgi:hypothetical protein
MKQLLHVLPLASAVCSRMVLAQGNGNLGGTWTVDRAATPIGRGSGGINHIPLDGTLVVELSPAEGER